MNTRELKLLLGFCSFGSRVGNVSNGYGKYSLDFFLVSEENEHILFLEIEMY